MTEIADLKAKLEADTRQFDQAMQGSNKHMEDAKKLVTEWSDEFKTASESVDKYIKKLENRIIDLENQNDKSLGKMGDANKRLKDNVDKNTEYIKKRYDVIGKSTEQATKQVSDFSRVMKWSLYFASAGLVGTTSVGLIKQQTFELNRELDETIRLMQQISGRSGENIARHIFNMNVPVGRDALTSAAYQMLASRQPANSVPGKLELLSDTTYGLGGDDQTFQSLATSMALLGNRGTEYEGFTGLANLGLDVDEYIKPLGDGSALAALERVERGAVSTEELVKQVMVGLSRDFSGLIDTQEQTYTSAMNTIGKYIEETARKFGESWYDKMRRAANNVSTLFVDIIESDEWSENMEGASKSIDKVFTSIARRAEQISRSVLPVLEGISNIAFTGIDVGAEVIKSADPALNVMTRTIEGIGKGLSWVTGLVNKLFENFKGLSQIVGIMFSARVIGRIAMFATNLKGLLDFFGFTNKLGGGLRKHAKGFVDSLRLGFMEANDVAKKEGPRALKGFAQGFKSAAVGIRDGFRGMITGIQSGFYKATENMSKGWRKFIRGFVGATTQGTKAFVNMTKGMGQATGLIEGGFIGATKTITKSTVQMTKGVTAAFSSLSKGLLVISKWITSFFTPYLAIVGAFHFLAEVMAQDNEIKERAAESNRTYIQSLRAMRKEIESTAEAFTHGTGPAFEPVNRRDTLSRMMFADEEQEQEAYRRHMLLYGEQAQSPFELLRNMADEDISKRSVIQNALEEAGVYDPNKRYFAGRWDQVDGVRKLLHWNQRDSSAGLLDKITAAITGIFVDERQQFKELTGGDDALFDHLRDILQSYNVETEQDKNFVMNFRRNIPELADILEDTPGFERRDLINELGLRPQQDLYIDSTIESLLREGTQDFDASEVAKFSVDVIEYRTRQEQELAEQLRNMSETYAAVDRAMLVNSRGLTRASNSLEHVASAALLAASGLESVADRLSSFLFEETFLHGFATVSGASATTTDAVAAMVENYTKHGMTLTEQSGLFMDAWATPAQMLIEYGLSNLSRQDIIPTTQQIASFEADIVAQQFQDVRSGLIAGGVKPEEFDVFARNFFTREEIEGFTAPVEFDKIGVQAIGERAGSLWRTQAEKGEDRLVKALDDNTAAQTDANNIARYGEDGHLVLEPGKTWDLNFGTAEVLRSDDVMDARIIAPDPFHVSSGGGTSGTRAIETSIPLHPQFTLPEVPAFDYSGIDIEALLGEHRTRREAIDNQNKQNEWVAEPGKETYDRATWAVIDAGSFDTMIRKGEDAFEEMARDMGAIVSDIDDVGQHFSDATSMMGFYAQAEMNRQMGIGHIGDITNDRTPIVVKLEVVDAQGNPIEGRVIHHENTNKDVKIEVDGRADGGRLHGPWQSTYTTSDGKTWITGAIT